MNTKATTTNQAFEFIYDKYYVKLVKSIHDNIKNGKNVLPDNDYRQTIIDTARQVSCAYRFVENIPSDHIEPLYPFDEKYPYSSHISNKEFFRKIHISYLIPYLVYSSFAYELALTLKNITMEQILGVCYQIPLPIKIKKTDDNYGWYIQKSKVLSVNEHNQVLTHINTYHFEQPILQGQKIENRFIEATVLQNEELNFMFQQLLKQKLTEYYKDHVFSSQHWIILNEKENKYSQHYKNDLNKEILNLVEAHSGYRFLTVKDAKAWLKLIKVIEDVN